MSKQAEGAIAAHIRKMAEDHNVAYVPASRDPLARQVTRLAGDEDRIF